MQSRILFVPATLLLAFGLACAGGSTEEPAEAPPAPAPAPAAPVLTGAGTEASPYVLTCDNNGKDVAGGPGTAAYVTCPAGCTSGSVWGVNPYTRDSRVCTAAVHAGALPVGGGTVQLNVVTGSSTYDGNTANGVTSRSWGAYDTSFSFTVAPVAVEARPEPPPRPSDTPHERRGDGRPNRPMKRQ